jgi:hypothetical protein
LVHLLLPDDLDLDAGCLHVRNKPELGWQVKTRNVLCEASHKGRLGSCAPTVCHGLEKAVLVPPENTACSKLAHKADRNFSRRAV